MCIRDRSNLFLAALIAIPFRAEIYSASLFWEILYYFGIINLFLFVFNLLPIPPLDLPAGIPERGWNKLATFSADLYGLRGTALFLDVDVVVTGSLDDFFTQPGEFLIIHDYKRPWRITGNSSVYRFELGAHPDVLGYFRSHFNEIRANFRNEQAYLSDFLHRQGKLGYWPKAWCPSFKYAGIPIWPTNYWQPPFVPEGARVVLQTAVLADDRALIDALHGRGFAQAREWVHFEALPAKAPVVELPQGVTIREMDQRFDWLAVGAVMDAAFADHWGEMGPHMRTLLEEDETNEAIADVVEDEEDEEVEDDPSSNSLGLCFVAEADGQVIGSCLCNARTVEWPDSGKLGSLSVLRPYRRLGVGRALTATALAEFHRRGIQRIITDTDNASFTGANRLYPRFGFRPYRYERVFEKELRAGVEWRAFRYRDLRP